MIRINLIEMMKGGSL